MLHYIVISVAALIAAAVLIFDFDFPGYKKLAKKYKEQLKDLISSLLLLFVIAYDMFVGNYIDPPLPWDIYNIIVKGLIASVLITETISSLNSRGKKLSKFFGIFLILLWSILFINLYILLF